MCKYGLKWDVYSVVTIVEFPVEHIASTKLYCQAGEVGTKFNEKSPSTLK